MFFFDISNYLFYFFEDMSKNILMVVANNGFQDVEFSVPYEIFRARSFLVDICAKEKWECVWVFWKRINANCEVDIVDSSRYDMVVFIWWWWAYSQYFWDKNYLKLAQKAKKIWSICITPMILSDSWILNGVKVTWWNQNDVQKNFITKNWWIFLDQDVVVCGNIVTANWPSAANLFAEKCVELILW